MPTKKQIARTNLDMDTIGRIFYSLDIDSKDYIFKQDLLQALHDRGILADDSRIRQTMAGLKKYNEKDRINAAAFRALVQPHITLIEKALIGDLVIPDFKHFASFITNLYNRTLQNTDGTVDNSIPELAKVDPNHYALSVCTVDGQRFNIGDYKTKFLARSTAKVFNYCLALKEGDETGMHQKGLFPKGDNITNHLEFLWRCLNIETTTEAQAVMAATLANAGVCPTNEQEVLTPRIARNCLAAMFMAGMRDYSNEYAFTIGLPAISGSSGAVLIVVPDVMGIVVWSPRVDIAGNSNKGIDFSHKLVERFNFHNFDSTIKNVNKVDPRLKKNETKMKGVMAVTAAASIGDLDELQRLYAAGVDLNEGEYDKRTGIHLAASEGHLEAVKFFIEKNVDINPKDRWGGTPFADAKREGHKEVLELLKKHGGTEKA